ncbi:unnamed protein product (macronuclear) [Paramecium tetraurelia]|uniref:EGF-like domain-containing protein n=1 Tax=Paramecium tetraurelia TaxID=5888 RepID=A0E3G9_PARTE|nr:uncharacterized protein GSPATT00023009001 [Paramecium tetraurelia]CAK89836.1 unnamed protein product [Paramecium tetraurelia]|eukprot:XP_001457233.1 hypothetical protein (macronuclear) [Paramecium tetraurelia strain d4-2]
MSNSLYHLFLLSFMLSVHCKIKVSEVCSCTDLKSENDCLQNVKCQWKSNSCAERVDEPISETEPESVYCKDLTQEVCINKVGCAYYNKKCIQFSGCTSYVYTTHIECQKVSMQCTSDGIQCIIPRDCSLNESEPLCSTVTSSSGSKKCVWEKTACRDQRCEEAPEYLNTDQACNSFINGCVTSGRGCVTKRVNCYYYDKDCDGMIGSDGQCESKNDKCQSKDCANAPLTYYTDQQCQSFRKGCRTTGIGCTDQTLKSCTTYSGDGDQCLKYIGNTGYCEEGTKGKCQARVCENAPNKYSTDEECKSYSPKCKTTGIGCVSILLNCSSYRGLRSECERRIGADGKCTSPSYEESSQCNAKVCSDAQFSTDRECGDYQYNCISNGVECTKLLMNCNKYKGDAVKCKMYVGIDGKCAQGSDGYCAVNACENAKFQTNEECKNVQSYCLSNGTKCVQSDTCPNTLQKISCLASDKCQWTEQCVTNQCQYFSTKGMCLRHSSNVECFWDGQACVDKQCKHAGLEYRTNTECQYFLWKCVASGLGCVDVSAPCEDYFGDEDTCTHYKGNNGKIPCVYNSATSKCRSTVCQDNQSALSQQDCDKTLEGCKFTGKYGCVNQNAECQEFYGDSQQCHALNSKCSQNLGEIGNCRPLECYDNQGALEDYECNLFKSGCVTKGVGCIASTAPCNQYLGNSIDDCSKFVGNGKKCWYDQGFSGQCSDKQCSHNVDAQNDQECNKFMQGCVFNEKGCQDAELTCDTYKGDEDTCSKYRGNGLQCVRIDYCEDRKCSDVQNPLSLQECEEYLSICAFDGGKCIEKQDSCDYYYGYQQEQCQILVNVDGDLCTNGEINFYCANRQCKDAQNVKSQKDCTSYRKNCIFNGIDKCEEVQDSCSTYNGFSEQGCKEAKNKVGKGCWFDINGKCKERTCQEVLTEYSTEICQIHDSSCIYTGSKCTKKQNTCSDYKTLSLSECRFLPNCWKSEDNNDPCQDRQCSDEVQSISDSACRNHLESCRFDGDNKCVDEKDNCTDYVNFTLSACQVVTNKKGEYCWYKEASSTCVNRTCQDTLPFYSAEDCVNHLSTCRYYGIKCQDAKDTCSQYIGFSKDACSQVKTKANLSCWYQDLGSICINATCDDFIKDASIENCLKHLPSCRYNGTRCIQAAANCNKYIASNQLCTQLTDASNKQCWYDIRNNQGMDSNCILKDCSNRQNLYSLDVCQQYIGQTVGNKYIPSCTYDGIKCINIQTQCSQYIGYNRQQCLNVTTLSGESCFQDPNNTSMTCRARRCSDNQTAVNNVQCDLFLKGCVTTGRGCTELTQTCNTYKGTQSSCLKFVGNGKKCRGSNLSIKCSVRECFHDQESTTDLACNSFMDGCVTNGKGCISNLEPCSSYIGNLQTCSTFKGNGRLCYSDSLVNIQSCRDRQCSDNTKAILDSDCNKFMPGCLSKGVGCIEDTQPCSSYYGTQALCSRFKGEKGTKPCWNDGDATSSTRCINRECNHLSRGTNDVVCNSFLEGCVSDGFQCLTKRNCSQFYGSANTCILFDALDKPCKGIDHTIQQCQKLLCSDAPNNYNTDEKCNQFKSGCKTTGYGCADSDRCEMLASKSLCKVRSDCQYIDGCLNNTKLCQQITKYSQCLNNANMKCSWNFATQKCRDWVCSDASVLLKKHEHCQALNPSCTTTGNGCIEINQCNKYLNKQTCLTAISLGYLQKCVWEINSCRDKVCEDAPISYTEDSVCKSISSECITAGYGCTRKQYACENLNIKSKCTKDYQGRPCLWITQTNSCMTFSQCSDIKKTTFAECQVYSKLCTSNGDSCMPLSKCAQYTNTISCNTGTDGVCGWVIGQSDQMQRCQIFQQCSDIFGSTKEDCQYYSNTCTSDGVKCIQIGNCSSYLTKIACNSDGKDGSCFWDQSSEQATCRLQQCPDVPLVSQMTYEYCSSFNPKLKCTTDGTKCMSKSICSDYLEQSCYEGIDGPCIFTFPLNRPSGSKLCRIKDCVDYQERTTAACSKLKSGCISDGIKCLQKQKCSDYTTQTACESDGLDGVCIFDGLNCSLMSKCEDANDNFTACSKKSKVCYFDYTKQNNTEVTTCKSITCSNSPDCSPILSFDETLITVCIQKTQSECIEEEPYKLAQSRCYSKSLYTYQWNTASSQCEKCVKSQVINTPSITDIYQGILTSIILVFLIVAI